VGTREARADAPLPRNLLRCPTCRARLDERGDSLACTGCGRSYPLLDGIPRLLDETAPGLEAKLGEIRGWIAMAQAQGWYEPDDAVDAVLPYVTRDLGWEDVTWQASEHSFSLLADRLRPGMRVLEVGAAKCWGAPHLAARGCTYVGTDILADPNIGLGRGAFYERRAGPFLRVQADGESLPFADAAFDVTYCVAALHHALDLRRMVAEMARVTRRGGIVAALNEGTRALRRPPTAPDQAEELGYGINEHAHTLFAYVAAFLRSGLLVTRVEQAEGYDDIRRRRIGGRLLRVPVAGRSLATWFAQALYGYQGASLFSRRVL
jgi:ubiquinone/menaquinone biosynthesis C-methylase UbiE/uncharacterized protein YbaR (Trm112 family)